MRAHGSCQPWLRQSSIVVPDWGLVIFCVSIYIEEGMGERLRQYIEEGMGELVWYGMTAVKWNVQYFVHYDLAVFKIIYKQPGVRQ